MKNALLYARVALSELAQLKNPVADVALVGLVVKLLPFVHVNTAKLVGVLAAVGLIASWGKTQLQNVPVKVSVRKQERALASGSVPEPDLEVAAAVPVPVVVDHSVTPVEVVPEPAPADPAVVPAVPPVA